MSNSSVNNVGKSQLVAELPPEQKQGLQEWGSTVGIQVESFRDLSVADLIATLTHATKGKQDSHNGPRQKVKFA